MGIKCGDWTRRGEEESEGGTISSLVNVSLLSADEEGAEVDQTGCVSCNTQSKPRMNIFEDILSKFFPLLIFKFVI